MDQAGQDLPEALKADLDVWRKTPFDRLKARADPLPALSDAVRQQRGDEGGKVSFEEIRTFLLAVVDTAESRAPASVSTEAGSYISNPAVIRIVFGLTLKSRDANVTDRLEKAVEAIKSVPRSGSGQEERVVNSGHTLRKKEVRQALIDKLAVWVAEFLHDQAPSAQVVPAAQMTGLVEREDDLAWLRATYNDLQRTGGGVFQIWGIAGVGKTTLAAQFADQIGPAHTIGVVRVGRRGLEEEDIRRFLRLEGHPESGWSDDYCHATFRRDIARPRPDRRIRLLVLDGVTTPEQVTALIPMGTSTPTLITARERLCLPDDAHLPALSAWRVKTFSYEQADQYLRTCSLDLDAETARQLSEEVGGHPESLAHIARYLGQPDAMPAWQLLHELHRQPRQALVDLAEELNVPACAAVAIEELLDKLDRSSLAYMFLMCLIWTEEEGHRPLSFLLDFARAFRGKEPSPLAVKAALNQLERLGLAGQIRDSLVTSRMTCRVLRDLTPGHCEPTLLGYERVVSQPADGTQRNLTTILRQEYHDTQHLQATWAEWMENTNTPPPVFLCVDERNWAFFVTTSQGRRRAALYRCTPGGIYNLNPNRGRWTEISDKKELDVIVQATMLHFEACALKYQERRKTRNLPPIPDDMPFPELLPASLRQDDGNADQS